MDIKINGKTPAQPCVTSHGYFCMLLDLSDFRRYPLAREGVFAPGGRDCLAHTRQKVSNMVDLTVLRLAFLMGYE